MRGMTCDPGLGGEAGVCQGGRGGEEEAIPNTVTTQGDGKSWDVLERRVIPTGASGKPREVTGSDDEAHARESYTGSHH